MPTFSKRTMAGNITMRQLAVMAPGPYFSYVFQGPGMILTCSSCSTRYSVDGSKFPAAGRTVRCAKCGNSWHQAPESAAEEPPPEPVEPQAPGTAQVSVPVPEGHPAGDEPEGFDSFQAGSASPIRDFAPQPIVTEPRPPMGPLLALIAGWAALVAVVLLIAVCAVLYRQHIVVLWPQSAGVYSSLGLNVNT